MSKVGATETTNGPEVAPEGMVILIDVLLQELTITGTSFRVTTLPPCAAPKLTPLITTVLPIVPVVPETLLIAGAGGPKELMETLSMVAVASEGLLLLVMAKPT